MLATGNNPLHTCRLSIRISTDGFSFYTYNVLDGALLQVQHAEPPATTSLQAHLEDELRKLGALGYDFKQVDILADTPSTCVPLEHFRREEMTAVYRLTFPTSTAAYEEIHYQILPSLEVVEVFSMPEELMNTVLAVFPAAQLSCYEGARLEETAAALQGKERDRQSLHAFIDKHSTMVCSFRAGKLVFASTYRIQEECDQAYMILAAWKSLGMDAVRDTLHMHGAEPTLLKQLGRFVKKIETCE